MARRRNRNRQQTEQGGVVTQGENEVIETPTQTQTVERNTMSTISFEAVDPQILEGLRHTKPGRESAYAPTVQGFMEQGIPGAKLDASTLPQRNGEAVKPGSVTQGLKSAVKRMNLSDQVDVWQRGDDIYLVRCDLQPAEEA